MGRSYGADAFLLNYSLYTISVPLELKVNTKKQLSFI